MKNKAVTYVLILVVAIVWGVIIYQIFSAANQGDDAPVASRPAIEKIKPEAYSVAIDTTHLLLDYPDPFLKRAAPVQKSVDRTAPLKKVNIQPLKPVINWAFISYSGYIKNAKSTKTLSIITINGKQYMLGEGESAENVKLQKNMFDSIKVQYHGTSKFIVMNNK